MSKLSQSKPSLAKFLHSLKISSIAERSLSEIMLLSALAHLIAFIAINIGAWLIPSNITPLPTSVEIISEKQLQQRLTQFRTSPKKKAEVESKKTQQPKQEQEKEKEDEKTVEKTEQPKPEVKKVAKIEKKKAEQKVKKPATQESKDPLEDLLSSLEDDSQIEEPSEEPSNDNGSIEDALDEAFTDNSEETTAFLSSEQILTPSELAAFRKHIYACWSPPIGAPSLKNLVVDLHLTIDKFAFVTDVRVIDRQRMASDPFFRSAAEAALRTLATDGACSPLKLPLEKYNLWQKTILRFDPRRLFGL